MISSSDSSVAALISAAIFNGAIAIALSILYFAYFRNKFRNVYFASSSPSSSSENEDMDIIKSHGLDSLLYIKYMNLGVVLFIPIAILACVILFPSYIIGQNEATGLSYLSIANISDTNRLWANWAISVFISLLVLFIVRMYLYEFLTLRSHFLNTTQTQKTLLIEDIKAEYQKEENLASLFQGVVSVEFQVLATKSGKLGKKIVKRDEMLNKTEAAIVAILKNVEKNKPRPKAAPKLFAKKADALHLYASKMEQLSNKIHDLQNELVKGSIASSNSTSAFVTFQNAVLAHAALNNSSAKAHCTMRHVSTCASDVYWPNLGLSKSSLLGRKLVGSLATLLLAIFWFIIVAFIGSISTLANLVELLPFLKAPLSTMPAAIIGIIQGVLPTVATAVFMAQLPLFLTLLTKFEGISSHALIKYSVQNKFYWFSFVTVFLGTALSSGILPAINELKQNPGSVVSILGVAIPGSATFFINYILLLSLIGPALELLQIGSVAFKLLLPKISDMTPRALFLLNQVPDFDFGLRYSPVSMIFLFGLVFSTINPLVAVAAAFYFVVSYFVFGIQLLNVYKLSVDTGGQYYPRALFTILTGLIVAQLVNVCLLFLKKAYGPGGAMAAVCILTIGGSIHLYTDFIGRRKRMLNDLLVALHDKGDMNPPEWIGEDLDYIHPNLSTVPVNVWVAGDDVAARFEAELTMHKLPVTTSCPHLIKETGGSTSNIYRPVERPLTDMHHDQHRLVSATTLIV